jgi:hypothetical protein
MCACSRSFVPSVDRTIDWFVESAPEECFSRLPPSDSLSNRVSPSQLSNQGDVGPEQEPPRSLLSGAVRRAKVKCFRDDAGKGADPTGVRDDGRGAHREAPFNGLLRSRSRAVAAYPGINRRISNPVRFAPHQSTSSYGRILGDSDGEGRRDEWGMVKADEGRSSEGEIDSEPKL